MADDTSSKPFSGNPPGRDVAILPGCVLARGVCNVSMISFALKAATSSGTEFQPLLSCVAYLCTKGLLKFILLFCNK